MSFVERFAHFSPGWTLLSPPSDPPPHPPPSPTPNVRHRKRQRRSPRGAAYRAPLALAANPASGGPTCRLGGGRGGGQGAQRAASSPACVRRRRPVAIFDAPAPWWGRGRGRGKPPLAAPVDCADPKPWRQGGCRGSVFWCGRHRRSSSGPSFPPCFARGRRALVPPEGGRRALFVSTD